MYPSLLKPTIFLVDDDPDEQILLKDALLRLTKNHNLRIAIHGRHLLELLSVSEERELPCLIILDSNMPVMDGKTTLKHLKISLRYRNIPAIVYSTSENFIEKEEYLSMGAAAFITKPDTIQGIVVAAKTMLGHCHVKSTSVV